MSAYSDKVIADGATNYWRLNETSGTSAVDVVGAKHGTISGGVTLNQAGALTDGDKAMAFNGTTGKVQAAGPVTLPVTSTVELWLKLPTLAGDYSLVSTRGLGTGDLVVFYLTNGIPVYYSTNGGGGGAGRIDTGQWRHVVYVFTTTTASVYVDGVLSGAPAAFTRTVASVGGVSFAWDNDNPLWYPGSLDDIAIYPRALTPAEISAHYTLGVTPLAPALGRDYNSVLAAFLPGTGDLTTEITAYLATLTGDMNNRWKQMEKNAGLSL